MRQRFSKQTLRHMERRGPLLFDQPRPEFEAIPHWTCQQCHVSFPAAEEVPLCPRCEGLKLPD